MRHSCVIGFLAVTLCLVGCLFANASFAEAKAKKSVDDAQKSVKTVFERANNELRHAKHTLHQVNVFKRRVENAALHSASAAKGYAEAETIAIEIKKLSNLVITLHPNTNKKLGKAVTDFEKLLLEAKQLHGKPDIKILPNDNSPNDYTDTNTKASELQQEATKLDTKISDVLTPMTDVYSTVNNMEKLAEEAKLSNYHISALVAVMKINTMVRDAELITLKTEQKKNEVNDTVKQMNDLSTEHSPKLIFYLNALCRNANGDLRDASNAVEKAREAKEAMLKEKALADAALENVQKATEFGEALSGVNIAEASVKKVEKIVPQLNSALQTAEICVTSATSLKQEAVRVLSNSNGEPGTEQSKVTEKIDLSEEEGIERHQERGSKKLTITNTVQPMGKELIPQSANKPENLVQSAIEFSKKGGIVKQTPINVKETTVQSPENSLHQASYVPVTLQADQRTAGYSEIPKDKLRKGTQNKTGISLIGGNVPALVNTNDSAMTVSVFLLGALILTALSQ